MANNAVVKGYKLDFVNNVLVMNYTFAAAAGRYGTPENKLLLKIQKDFPNLNIIEKSGREQKTPKKNKRLTYANMEKHLSCYSNSADLLTKFNEVKAASVTAKSPYKYVSDWFKMQCPDYASPATNFDRLTLVNVTSVQSGNNNTSVQEIKSAS